MSIIIIKQNDYRIKLYNYHICIIIYHIVYRAILEIIVSHPIDYIKTMKQKHTNYTIKDVKIRKIYTGSLPRLIGIIPMRNIFWSTQSEIKRYLVSNNINHKTNFIYVGSGSAFMQTLFDYPVESMKTKIISNEKIIIRDLFKYKGYVVNLCRNVIFSSVFTFFCYNNNNNSDNIDNFNSALVGSVLGSIISQPFDYIKTIKQLPYSTIYNGIKISDKSTYQILIFYIKNNYKQLFSGSYYRALLSAASMTTGFCAFNYIENHILSDK